MSYQIISDSCCDYTDDVDLSFVRRVALTIQLDDHHYVDDEDLDCAGLVQDMAASENAPKSACPSPGAWEEAFDSAEGDIYVLTLSAELSGSYNSARSAAEEWKAEHPDRNIYVFNSRSAASGQTLLSLELNRLAGEEGLPFEEVVRKGEAFIDQMVTYFVLESMEVFRKNGRLSRLQSLAVSALRLKMVMKSTDAGYIEPAGKALSVQQALTKMVQIIRSKTEGIDLSERTVVISHICCPERAKSVLEVLQKECHFGRTVLCRGGGISSMYANNGGIIICY